MSIEMSPDYKCFNGNAVLCYDANALFSLFFISLMEYLICSAAKRGSMLKRFTSDLLYGFASIVNFLHKFWACRDKHA